MQNGHKTKMILIPGNPGLIKFYDCFLDEVHRLQKREVEILGVSHANHFLSKKSSYVYDLEQQVEHKKQVLRREIKKEEQRGVVVDLVLVGHSIGCYMILEALKDATILNRVKHCILLFPTVERMK